jgi:hypothetical protein
VINIVWVPQQVIWDEPAETWCEILELAADPDLGANNPRAYGPYRKTKYDATTFEILEQQWVFQGVTWTAPEGVEQPSIDAWAAWQQSPPE